MNRKYSGFTLVEMLIVMGIIIILMVVGITAGRFAINRANDVAHKNAVDQVYVSLQAYYTDEREYPTGGGKPCTGTVCTFAELVGDANTSGLLVPYIDAYSFDGSSISSYFYGVGGDGGNQAVLVCVTLRGDALENSTHPDGAVYCAGNGIGVPDMDFGGATPTTVTVAEMKGEGGETDDPAWTTFSSGGSEWDKGWN